MKKKPAEKEDDKILFSFSSENKSKVAIVMKEHKEKLKNAEVYRKRTMLTARRLLQLKTCEAYRINYKKYCDKAWDALESLPFISTEQYAIQCKEIIDNKRILGVLLGDLTAKAIGKAKST